MIYSKVLAILALSLSAAAAPLANKPFKIGVTFDNRVLYITDNDEASENIADGAECVLTGLSSGSSKIACGKSQGSFSYNEMHPLSGAMKPAANGLQNRNWAIGNDDIISWKTDWGSTISFSLAMMDPSWLTPNDISTTKKIYAEVCSTYRHPDGLLFKPGVAKAYYV